jgi:hypothetical protein
MSSGDPVSCLHRVREGPGPIGQVCRDAQDAKRDIPVPLSPSLVTTGFYAPAALRPQQLQISSLGSIPLLCSHKWLDGVSDALAYGLRWLQNLVPPPLRPYARALRLPETTRLRFALHGAQRQLNDCSRGKGAAQWRWWVRMAQTGRFPTFPEVTFRQKPKVFPVWSTHLLGCRSLQPYARDIFGRLAAFSGALTQGPRGLQGLWLRGGVLPP